MSELVRTLVLCGILSGTQPVTTMGLLLVMRSVEPRRNGLAYVAGSFAAQAVLLIGASGLFGSSVEPDSAPGRSFVGIRIAAGVALFVAGALLRRPPRAPAPAIPKVLERLQGLGPRQAFVAGIVVADYQGPVLASLALAAADVGFRGRLAALGVYALLATGVPLGFLIWSLRSATARARLERVTNWVMANRRRLASYAAIGIGVLLVGDGVLSLA